MDDLATRSAVFSSLVASAFFRGIFAMFCYRSVGLELERPSLVKCPPVFPELQLHIYISKIEWATCRPCIQDWFLSVREKTTVFEELSDKDVYISWATYYKINILQLQIYVSKIKRILCIYIISVRFDYFLMEVRCTAAHINTRNNRYANLLS